MGEKTLLGDTWFMCSFLNIQSFPTDFTGVLLPAWKAATSLTPADSSWICFLLTKNWAWGKAVDSRNAPRLSPGTRGLSFARLLSRFQQPKFSWGLGIGEMVNVFASFRGPNPSVISPSIRAMWVVFLGDMNSAKWFPLTLHGGSLLLLVQILSRCTLDFSLANTLAGDWNCGCEYCPKCWEEAIILWRNKHRLLDPGVCASSYRLAYTFENCHFCCYSFETSDEIKNTDVTSVYSFR